MVKLGFIVEGATEKIILEKSDFFDYLRSLKIDYVSKIEDAEGNGNLLPHNILEHSKILVDKGATHIFILTDLDKDKCITETKNRISASENRAVVISVKEIESWYLADSSAMGSFLKDSSYYCDSPESIIDPFTEIKNRRLAKINRGIDDKVILAKLIVKNNGFSILKAAEHPNCNSAKYFLKKIKELTTL
jgi:hypothetical protein